MLISDKAAQEYVLEQFKVALHDYITQETHPMHGFAVMAQLAARRVLQLQHRLAEIRQAVSDSVWKTSGVNAVSRAVELTQAEAQTEVWTEVLREAMYPMLPRPQD